MAKDIYVRKTGSIDITWDSSGLADILDQLDPLSQEKMQNDALNIAGKKLVAMVKSDALRDGLGRRTFKERGGWKWYTYGRIPNSIVAGKPWKRRGSKLYRGLRVFVSGSRKRGFLKHAPHASPTIAGFTQRIPNRKTKSTQLSGREHLPRPVFNRARSAAPGILKPAIEEGINRLVRRLNRKYSK